MKRLFGVIAVFALTTASWAQPDTTWQATFQTPDGLFTDQCDGQGSGLGRHATAYVFFDENDNGPDSSDGTPRCIHVSGMGCEPEAPLFSYRNFPLQPDGLLNSPLFWGRENIEGPHGNLRVYLRIFFGADVDSCYTSPVVEIPEGGGSVAAVWPRSSWTCGPALVPRPDCYGNSTGVYFTYTNPDHRSECLLTCDGGLFYVDVHTDTGLFRPPVIDIAPGCADSCDPADSCGYHAGGWTDFMRTGFWTNQFRGTDVGCLTVSQLDSIPCMRLDTMIALVDRDTVELHWSTSREDSLTTFQIWRPVPYGGQPEDHFVADVPAQNLAGGAQYAYRDRNAVVHGRYIAYLLVIVDQRGKEYGAAYLELRIADVESSGASAPKDYSLSSFPNPFNPTTTLTFTLPRAGRTTILVYDLLGRKVADLTDEIFEAGEHRIEFNASSLPSGLYFARLQSGNVVATQKLLLLK